MTYIQTTDAMTVTTITSASSTAAWRSERRHRGEGVDADGGQQDTGKGGDDAE